MKIALLTHKLKPPFIGGVDVYTDRLGRALQRLGHIVTYLAFDSDGAKPEIVVQQEEHSGASLWRILFAFDSLPAEAFATVYNRDMGQVAREIFSQEQPDLVIILNFYMITLAPVEAAQELGLPVAHIATDFVPVCRRGTYMRWNNQTCAVGESVQTCATCYISHRPLGRLGAAVLEKMPLTRLEKWAARKESLSLPHPLWLAKPYLNHVDVMVKRLEKIRPLRASIDQVFVPTSFTGEVFAANGFTAEQITLLPFGIEEDSPLSRVQHTAAENIRFMFLGRLQPYKGAHLLLEAFNSLADPQGATLTIYGAADGHEAYFQELQVMMQANPQVRFAGLIQPTKLADAFAEADVFLLPSTWHENSPLILLDALQSQTAVIASDIGGVRGIVEHERNGLLFPMGDGAALREQMQQLISDRSLCAQLQQGGSLGSIDLYAQQMLAIMAEYIDLGVEK